MFFYIGGISGVGKTITIESILQLAHEKCIKLEIAPLKETLCTLAGVETVEEFRLLPESFRSNLHPQAREILYEIDASDFKTIRIYDSHFCSLNQEGKEFIIRSVHREDRKRIKGIAILTANPLFIAMRRIQDYPKRIDRHQFNISQLSREQDKEIEVAMTQARELGVSCITFDNTNSSVFSMSEEIFVYIQQIIAGNR